MILQNKKTGVLGVLEANTYHGGRPDNIIEVYEMGMGAVKVLAQYKTLEGLLGEWEDYKPKVPLIKDEKIRKAVRSWAEANDVESAFITIDEQMNWSVFGDDIDRNRFRTQFYDRVVPDENINHRYTIAELCGEEKE